MFPTEMERNTKYTIYIQLIFSACLTVFKITEQITCYTYISKFLYPAIGMIS
jgi:hypothetical protein